MCVCETQEEGDAGDEVVVVGVVVVRGGRSGNPCSRHRGRGGSTGSGGSLIGRCSGGSSIGSDRLAVAVAVVVVVEVEAGEATQNCNSQVGHVEDR